MQIFQKLSIINVIMDDVLCPKCGEIIFEEPSCEANGIITCDRCKNQIKWKCDGKNTITKVCE